MKSALVTGGAGFIGSHLVDRLLSEGWRVTVVDNFDPFYDPGIKCRNIAPHLEYSNYTLVEADIRDMETLRQRLSGEYDVIVHLAAKAGVRPSIRDPICYQEVNVRGTQNLLELAREWGVKQFVFASSSSVYGVNPNVPWREDDCVLMPISPYAATKVAGELLGHVYSHLYGIRFIALRLFTVYGPRQRPDLAIHKFARKMLKGEPIPIYGDGTSRRDYTYIDDVIQGMRAAMDYTESQYEIINVGNNKTVSLLEMVRALEEVLEVKARLDFQPPQPGDVPQTWADLEKAGRLLCYRPCVPFPEGLKCFAIWLMESIDCPS
ncbi:UDP-glucuronate 4-epimerase [Desulfofundulus australicus DSM 11792]|uniref:UDP-glucuronate 4-epimerase n=1 Tax=Desulfofundulus australicus DSM 11792 TaxID=1121425 RepID=A0A1M4VGA0_9FIRM|nr:NAD-dependent epimerase/dehydratase family protein [Desulfofundulus australicus]SHE68064.1 UDP-glucuronate 4-epimerase [Desulfofundulus australicus DSM 11792]